ncbi:unnamed protein product [Triticum turgidum subsp. durum]|uniref:Uncharacterized protein n=1 Tax=Triticum turgidum subsp. durum TaxID=4567 RepID=A0A9R0RCH8_TRITD|nr:unnamed protein product [Triticum turgidum subsp. durum]
MDEAEAVLFYRHVTPIAWLRLQTYLNIGHHKKMTKAQQMKAVVAAVLPRFRVEVAAGAVVRPKLSIILHMKDGLKVRVYKRQDDAR